MLPGRATESLAAGWVRRRHRVTVIHATGAPQNRSAMDRRECGVSGRGALLVVLIYGVGFSLGVSGLCPGHAGCRPGPRRVTPGHAGTPGPASACAGAAPRSGDGVPG